MNTIYNGYTDTIKNIIQEKYPNQDLESLANELGIEKRLLKEILNNSNEITIQDRIDLYNRLRDNESNNNFEGSKYSHKFIDSRGSHIKYFVNNGFQIDEVFATHSNKDVIRGFHTSIEQSKIIKVLNGSIEFIEVDTAQKTIDISILTNENKPKYIKQGIWIGYRVIEDNTIVSYLCNGNFNPNYDLSASPKSFVENGWLWNIDEDKAIISEKDASAPKLNL